jgi:hypothetical protein
LDITPDKTFQDCIEQTNTCNVIKDCELSLNDSTLEIEEINVEIKSDSLNKLKLILSGTFFLDYIPSLFVWLFLT